MKKISRRKFIKLSAQTTALTLLPGCVKKVRVGDKATIRLVDGITPAFTKMIRELLEKFHQEHPNIKVTHEPYGTSGFEDKVLTQAIAGTAPDVFAGGDKTFFRLIEMDQALDLEPFIQTDLSQEIKNDFAPTQFNAYLSDDGKKRFAIPRTMGVIALYYNKSIFREEKISFPDGSWTHADYRENIKKFVKKNAAGRVIRWGGYGMLPQWDRLDAHLHSFGGSFQNGRYQCTLGDPKTQSALEWLRSLIWEDNAWPQPSQMENYYFPPWTTGKLATIEDGNFMLSYFVRGIDNQFEWDIVPFPIGPAGNYTSMNDDSFMVYKQTKYPEACWELIKFLTSREFLLGQCQAEGPPPSRFSLMDEYIQIMQEQHPVLKKVNIKIFYDQLRSKKTVKYPYFPQFGKIQEIINPIFDQVFMLGKAPVSKFTEAAEKTNQFLSGLQQKLTS